MSLNEIPIIENDLKDVFWQLTLERIRLQKAVAMLQDRLKERERTEKVNKDGEPLSE